MKKILCPTDFSDAAHGAIAYAAKLAKAVGATLTLLHVKSIFDFSLAEIDSPSVSTLRVAQQLEEQSREVARTFKISCDAEVVSKASMLSSVISDVAKDYDLVVIGTNGAEDIYQFFSGSNAYNAIVKTETPVLLIPEGFTYSEIKTMVYAYDYLRERDLPLDHLTPFVTALKCSLTVLQIMEEAYSKEAEDELKELQFIIRSKHTDLRYQYDTIHSNETAQSINSYITRNHPDVLALCSVHRNMVARIFHKSIIKDISAVCRYPVYIFHK